MIKTDPIRMSDFHHQRAIVFAPIEAGRQFKISAFLAVMLIAATAVVSATAFFETSQTAQTVPTTAVIAQAS